MACTLSTCWPHKLLHELLDTNIGGVVKGVALVELWVGNSPESDVGVEKGG